MASLFARIKAGLAKTANQIRDRMAGLETPSSSTVVAAPVAGRPLGLETLDALEDALLTADVGLEATNRILDTVRRDPSGSVRDRVVRVMRQILADVTPAPA